MKPRRLMMQAFGPYADKETIDFTVLKNHQLFLITGPTGSGMANAGTGVALPPAFAAEPH